MLLKNLPYFVTVIAIACCFFVGNPALEAQTITYRFNGALNVSGAGVPSPPAGFSGLFSVDQFEPDLDPSASAGLFNLSNVSVTFNDGVTPSLSQGEITQSILSGTFFQNISFSNGLGTDIDLLFSPNGTDPNTFLLIDSGEFDGGEGFVSSGIGFGGITFLSIETVPEPSGLPLALLVVARCAFWRRRSA